jgi:hypothetical protein
MAAEQSGPILSTTPRAHNRMQNIGIPDRFELLQISDVSNTSYHEADASTVDSFTFTSASKQPEPELVTGEDLSTIVRYTSSRANTSVSRREKANIYVSVNSNLQAPVRMVRKACNLSCRK